MLPSFILVIKFCISRLKRFVNFASVFFGNNMPHTMSLIIESDTFSPLFLRIC